MCHGGGSGMSAVPSRPTERLAMTRTAVRMELDLPNGEKNGRKLQN